MSKNLRTAVVAGLSVILAGITLEYKWGRCAAAGAVAAGIAVGYFCGFMAKRQLPEHPRTWAKWVGGREAIPDSVLVLIAAAALYFAVEWGKDVDKIDASLTGLAAFGAIAGVAFVKVLDEFASESDWIDKRVEKFAKRTFKDVYEPMLGRPELPDRTSVDGHSVYTLAYHAVHTDNRYEGWGPDGRARRASDIAKALATAGSESGSRGG